MFRARISIALTILTALTLPAVLITKGASAANQPEGNSSGEAAISPQDGSTQPPSGSSDKKPLIPLVDKKLPSKSFPDSLSDLLRPPPNGPGSPEDHRSESDAQKLRESRATESTVAPFGYSYFAHPRKLIEVRRARLEQRAKGEQSIAAGRPGTVKEFTGDSTAVTSRAADPPTEEEFTAVAALTDAQKIDLQRRKQEGKLLPGEQRLYRTFLTPRSAQDASTSASGPANRSRSSSALEGSANEQTAIDAYREIADPISQIYRPVIASVPANYQLAAGDQILLRYNSRTLEPQETTFTVDQTGQITVPVVGRFTVYGQTLAQAEAALQQKFQRFYRDPRVHLSLDELRTIPITLLGESFSPGTYYVSAGVTAFNMIYATGGPTDNGSLRRIELRRRGELVTTIDLYKFLISGGKSADVPLQAGDVLYIPVRRTQVRIVGEVSQPAIYELTDAETLFDGIQYSGGVKPSAVAQRIQISTVRPGESRVLKDIDVTDPTKAHSTPLYDGDVVEVFSVRTTLTNKVTIEGAVDQPSDYAFTAGMTVADLVERARGLLSEAYPVQAHLYRFNPDNTLTLIQVDLQNAVKRDPAFNFALQRWDRLKVFTRQEIAWTGRREVSVRGAVQKEGIFERSENMRLRDLLTIAGGALPGANLDEGVLVHQHPDGTFAFQFVSLTRAAKDFPTDNVPVQDRDVLIVRRTDEARFTPEHSITVLGEAVYPGLYPRGEAMHLSDVIKLSGGLKPDATNTIIVAHARKDEGAVPLKVTSTGNASSTGGVTPDPMLEDGDVVTIQGRGEFVDKPAVIFIRGAVNRPGPVTLTDPEMRLTEAIAAAGGLKSGAYPQGAQFFRSESRLNTDSQKQIAETLTKLNDLLNHSEYERSQAVSEIERLKAVGRSAQPQLPIPGVSAPDGSDPGAAIAQQAAGRVLSHELVSQPRSLKPADLQANGNVAIDLPAAIKYPLGEDDLVMVDSDAIVIPETPTTIQVVGAVQFSRGVLYHKGERLDYYISRAGGFAQDAARDRILVIRLGGGLLPIAKAREFLPGDVILVPTKVLAAKIASHSNDIDTFFRALTTSSIIFFVAQRLFGF